MIRPDPDQVEYVNRLERMDPDDLARIAEWVTQLDDHPGWQAITTFLDETHGDLLKHLLATHKGMSGKPLPPEEYARRIGFLAGLNEFEAVKEAFRVANERRMERNQKAIEGL